ncbi:MAG: DinB family protein [Chloroflexota bacterium]
MLNFVAIRNGESTLEEVTAQLTTTDLAALTDEMIDTMLDLIANCTDADVVFVPEDPEAKDTFADSDDPAIVNLAWTLGHVVVHVTASSEEAAALAAELARGVENHGRSRYETPWQKVRTIAQCRERLEESRRMRLASLDMWPAIPHLDNRYKPYPSAPEMNAVGRFIAGLFHDDAHLGQIADIVGQAKAARM